jgi:large conductance mechanosensitive channel
MGGIDFTDRAFTINSPFFTDYSVTISYGVFFQAVVNFFIIAVCVFFLVKLLNIISRKKEAEPKLEPQIILLSEIRDALRGECCITNDNQMTFDDTEPKSDFCDGGGGI